MIPLAKSLVVVESPAKAKTIEKFLGKNFQVKASMGHLRDLPRSQFGVDIEQGFRPKYINIRGKGDIIKALKEAARQADKVYLATDPDREGEAIAWHLAHLLGLEPEERCRIEFHEITKNAVTEAIQKPRHIDCHRVEAQQTRRILDRIVGYKLSPLLWRKVRKGLSAGRVQSVAVRLICDREREIGQFVSQEYWTITAKLRADVKGPLFAANLIQKNGEKISITNEAEANAILAELSGANYQVTDVKRRERRRNPSPPFTTSSLQQEAARKLGFSAKKTMMLAQQLYEGLEVGTKGAVGLVTYIRTDSTRVSALSQQEARQYITGKYGEEYIPEDPRQYTTREGAQDAHEAIRPTYMDLEPDQIREYLTRDQYRLYKLIWERFVASQMSPAILDTLTIDIGAGAYLFRATGSQIKFPGFMILYIEGKDEEEQEAEIVLPDLAVGQVLRLHKLAPEQHFTQPPPRYTEASLVKTLEEQGIGRPSTYAPIIDTIQQRGYVYKEDKRFRPTELGFVVVDLLKEFFPDIIDVTFTANMESQLDQIAEGQVDGQTVLKEFYQPFAATLETADAKIGEVELPVEVTEEICEHCGRNMVIKHGRYGKFLACPGFPACRNTKPILQETGVSCPVCGGDVVERKSKRGRPFYGCRNYPECTFVTWDRPVQKACPQCGAFLVTKGSQRRKEPVYTCVREGCGYTEEISGAPEQSDAKLTNKGRKKHA